MRRPYPFVSEERPTMDVSLFPAIDKLTAIKASGT